MEPKAKINISASLMCADQLNLLDEIRSLEKAGIDAFHIDIMDNHFVPNLGLSVSTLKMVQEKTKLPLEVHLMLEYPESILYELINLGVDLVVFHIESKFNPQNIFEASRQSPSKIGLAISPATPYNVLTDDILRQIDYLLFLTVNPGFSGQPIVENVFEKIKSFVESQDDYGLEYLIDGHVDRELLCAYHPLGIRNYVGGSSGLFLKGKLDEMNYKKNLMFLRNGR